MQFSGAVVFMDWCQPERINNGLKSRGWLIGDEKVKLLKQEEMVQKTDNNGGNENNGDSGNEQSDEIMRIKICHANEGVQELMGGFHEGVIAMLRAYGFKDFVFFHPRYNCDVSYFIKGDTVIVVDSYSNFFVAEALGEEEKEWLINNIKENKNFENTGIEFGTESSRTEKEC